jgi:hypothetical protein
MLQNTVITALTLGLGLLASNVTASQPIESMRRWSGTHSRESLRKLAPRKGFVTDARQFRKIWNAWRRDEDVPKVNFERDFVLIGTVSGPNSVIMRPMLHEGGDLRFTVGGTKIGGPGFGYRILKVNRDRVKSVNGIPVGGKSTSAYIDVEILGRLRVGVVAIGGETTGTTITANGITWELDFEKNQKWPRVAGQLDGKEVLIKGRLERRAGVEIKERWIVTVSSFKFADVAGRLTR